MTSIIGNPQYVQGEKNFWALGLDGSSAIDEGTDTKFYFNYTNPFSVSFRIMINYSASSNSVIISRFKVGVLGNWAIYTNGAKIYFKREKSPFTPANTNTSLQHGTWYSISCVYDGTNLQIYVNGAADGSAVASGDITANQSDIHMVIGSYTTATGYNLYFKGLLSRIFFHSKALSLSEIQEISNFGYVSDSLIAYYDFDGNRMRGTAGTRFLNKNWPVEKGLTAGTTSQKGNITNLIPEKSNISLKEKTGIN